MVSVESNDSVRKLVSLKSIMMNEVPPNVGSEDQGEPYLMLSKRPEQN